VSATNLDLAKLRSELTTVALLGTERRAFQPPRLPDSVGFDPLFAAVTSVAEAAQSPEEVVALTAMLLDLYRRTGTSASVVNDEAGADIELPTSDPKPPPSAAATQLLDLLLTGTVAVARQNDALLAVWFEGCSRSNQRIEYRQLVEALNRSNGVPELRTAIVGALGERGMFLARVNKSWSWALRKGQLQEARINDEPIDADTFAQTIAAARPTLLSNWRKRDPAAAVALLAQTWAKENASDRGAFVECLRTGLSETDEPFLEAALNDKAKSVRFAAAKLLALLPTSAWVARMQERVNLVVSMTGTPRNKVEFVLPDETIMDASWVRDGLERPPVQKGTVAPQTVGPRAWALTELAKVAPLGCWEQSTQQSPKDLVNAAVVSDVRNELFIGWAQRTLELGHEQWALALIDQPNHSHLLSALGSQAGNSYVADIVRTTPKPYDIVMAMSQIQGPPSEELLTAFVSRLEREAPGWLPMDQHMVTWFHDATPALLERLARQAPDAEKHIRQIHAAQSLRLAINKEFP
jgi:Family of unknown function (DUF5691)